MRVAPLPLGSCGLVADLLLAVVSSAVVLLLIPVVTTTCHPRFERPNSVHVVNGYKTPSFAGVTVPLPASYRSLPCINESAHQVRMVRKVFNSRFDYNGTANLTIHSIPHKHRLWNPNPIRHSGKTTLTIGYPGTHPHLWRVPGYPAFFQSNFRS